MNGISTRLDCRILKTPQFTQQSVRTRAATASARTTTRAHVSKLHYRTHGTKGFPSTTCPNCTTAHTEPRVSRFQTSQLLSEPRATQAEPGVIPSLIYNTNKKTGWRNRSTSRILKGGRGDSLDNRNLNKLLLGKVRSLYTEINYQPHRKNVPKYFKTILSKVRQSRLHGTPHKTCSRIVNIYIEHVTES